MEGQISRLVHTVPSSTILLRRRKGRSGRLAGTRPDWEAGKKMSEKLILKEHIIVLIEKK